jgi:predicted enzyme related to lactoylglutathione lyase
MFDDGSSDIKFEGFVMRLILIVLLCLPSATVLAQQSVPAPIVYFDIASTDGPALQEFYADLFGWTSSPIGEVSVPVVSPLLGLIRQDPAEKRIYIGVEDITTKLEEIVERGGVIDAPRFEVPGVVILGLFKDPAGNPMALIEMEDGAPKVP